MDNTQENDAFNDDTADLISEDNFDSGQRMLDNFTVNSPADIRAIQAASNQAYFDEVDTIVKQRLDGLKERHKIRQTFHENWKRSMERKIKLQKLKEELKEKIQNKEIEKIKKQINNFEKIESSSRSNQNLEKFSNNSNNARSSNSQPIQTSSDDNDIETPEINFPKYKVTFRHATICVKLPSKCPLNIVLASKKSCQRGVNLCKMPGPNHFKSHTHYIIDMEGHNRQLKHLITGKSGQPKYWGNSHYFKNEGEYKRTLGSFF